MLYGSPRGIDLLCVYSGSAMPVNQRLKLPTNWISHIASSYSYFSRTEHPSIPPDETRENTKIVEHNTEGFSVRVSSSGVNSAEGFWGIDGTAAM